MSGCDLEFLSLLLNLCSQFSLILISRRVDYYELSAAAKRAACLAAGVLCGLNTACKGIARSFTEWIHPCEVESELLSACFPPAVLMCMGLHAGPLLEYVPAGYCLRVCELQGEKVDELKELLRGAVAEAKAVLRREDILSNQQDVPVWLYKMTRYAESGVGTSQDLDPITVQKWSDWVTAKSRSSLVDYIRYSERMVKALFGSDDLVEFWSSCPVLRRLKLGRNPILPGMTEYSMPHVHPGVESWELGSEIFTGIPVGHENMPVNVRCRDHMYQIFLRDVEAESHQEASDLTKRASEFSRAGPVLSSNLHVNLITKNIVQNIMELVKCGLHFSGLTLSHNSEISRMLREIQGMLEPLRSGPIGSPVHLRTEGGGALYQLAHGQGVIWLHPVGANGQLTGPILKVVKIQNLSSDEAIVYTDRAAPIEVPVVPALPSAPGVSGVPAAPAPSPASQQSAAFEEGILNNLASMLQKLEQLELEGVEGSQYRQEILRNGTKVEKTLGVIFGKMEDLVRDLKERERASEKPDKRGEVNISNRVVDRLQPFFSTLQTSVDMLRADLLSVKGVVNRMAVKMWGEGSELLHDEVCVEERESAKTSEPLTKSAKKKARAKRKAEKTALESPTRITRQRAAACVEAVVTSSAEKEVSGPPVVTTVVSTVPTTAPAAAVTTVMAEAAAKVARSVAAEPKVVTTGVGCSVVPPHSTTQVHTTPIHYHYQESQQVSGAPPASTTGWQGSTECYIDGMAQPRYNPQVPQPMGPAVNTNMARYQGPTQNYMQPAYSSFSAGYPQGGYGGYSMPGPSSGPGMMGMAPYGGSGMMSGGMGGGMSGSMGGGMSSGMGGGMSGGMGGGMGGGMSSGGMGGNMMGGMQMGGFGGLPQQGGVAPSAPPADQH